MTDTPPFYYNFNRLSVEEQAFLSDNDSAIRSLVKDIIRAKNCDITVTCRGREIRCFTVTTRTEFDESV